MTQASCVFTLNVSPQKGKYSNYTLKWQLSQSVRLSTIILSLSSSLVERGGIPCFYFLKQVGNRKKKKLNTNNKIIKYILKKRWEIKSTLELQWTLFREFQNGNTLYKHRQSPLQLLMQVINTWLVRVSLTQLVSSLNPSLHEQWGLLRIRTPKILENS